MPELPEVCHLNAQMNRQLSCRAIVSTRDAAGSALPGCGTGIQEIAAGSTRSLICERCRPEHD